MKKNSRNRVIQYYYTVNQTESLLKNIKLIIKKFPLVTFWFFSDS
jgi:hypothetical protein